MADSNASLNQDIFDIPMAQIESIIEPDGVGDDIGWGRLAVIGGVCIYPWTDFISYSQLTWQYPNQKSEGQL